MVVSEGRSLNKNKQKISGGKSKGGKAGHFSEALKDSLSGNNNRKWKTLAGAKAN